MKQLSRFLKKSSVWLFLAVMIASAGLSPAKVIATDATFRSLNGIQFFSPDACRVGGGEGTDTLVGNDNLEKILRFFVGKGLTLVQAAGIAGNFKRESGFNPAIIQGGAIADANYSPVNGVGFGLAQWTFTSRQKPLVDLANSTNRPIIDLQLQLDYTWQELSGPYAGSLENLKQSTEPGNAAYVFHRDYEGSADTEEEVRQNRGGDAIAIYNDFKEKIPDGSTTTTSSSTACTGTGKASAFVDGFTIYNQNDPQWNDAAYGASTIGAAGCGPSAMAMIITNLTGQTVTPLDTANYGANHNPSTLYNNGISGSLHNVHEVIGEHWGLSSTYVGKDVAKINQGLRDGGLVIMAGSGAAPFTSAGHFIVVRAVTAEGKWLVGDSNGTAGIENSEKEYDPQFILDMVGSYSWLLTK